MASSTTITSLLLSEQVSPPSLTLETKTLAAPTPGTAIVSVLSTALLSYAKNLLAGNMDYPLSLPMTPGGGAIVRITAVPNDATVLQPGQLCYLETTIKGRDEPGNSILLGLHGGANAASRTLMDGQWRHGTWATAAAVPLENLYALDEKRLCGEYGYSVHDLAYLNRLMVPMGGLSDAMDVKPGDRVVIAPATGAFGGAAVEVARALGADVVMCGRNGKSLERLRETLLAKSPAGGTIDVAVLTGDPGADSAKIGVVDKYQDFTPPAAAKNMHVLACMLALKNGGTACLMGGVQAMLEVPYGLVMFNNLTIKGKFMYTREAVKRMIGLVESGRVGLGEKRAGHTTKKVFAFGEWKEALDMAEKESGWGVQVCFEPGKE